MVIDSILKLNTNQPFQLMNNMMWHANKSWLNMQSVGPIGSLDFKVPLDLDPSVNSP